MTQDNQPTPPTHYPSHYLSHYDDYRENGWCLFDYDDVLADWIRVTLPEARATVSDPRHQQWLRHDGTWFAGVNVLNNDVQGKVQNGRRLQGSAVTFIEQQLGYGLLSLDKAQLSVCYPGYPKQGKDESIAAHGYRLRRDAAHVDGLLKHNGQRYCREYHDYILAIAMVEFSHDAAPFVVWRGSHEMVRQALQKELHNHPPERWADIAITQVYTDIRKQVFEQCERLELDLKPGQAFLGHRLLLHGTAPWQAKASASADGRMICFFRPASLSIEQWLDSE